MNVFATLYDFSVLVLTRQPLAGGIFRGLKKGISGVKKLNVFQAFILVLMRCKMVCNQR